MANPIHPGRNSTGLRLQTRVGEQIKSRTLVASKTLRIVVLIGLPTLLYAWLIWFFLTAFGWKAALALGLAIPAVGILVVAVWYFYASGLYQVIHDMRQKAAYERRLKKMLKRAMRQMLEET